MRNEENEDDFNTNDSNSKGTRKNQKIKLTADSPSCIHVTSDKPLNVSKPHSFWLFEFSIKWGKVGDMLCLPRWVVVIRNCVGVCESHTDIIQYVNHHPHYYCDTRLEHTMFHVTLHLSSSNSMMLNNHSPFILTPENIIQHLPKEISPALSQAIQRHTKNSLSGATPSWPSIYESEIELANL